MKIKTISAVAVLAVAAAGFSSASVGAAPSTPSAVSAAKSTDGVTATTVTVEALGYKTFYGDSLLGAQARFKRANDAGGVNGRKIVLKDFVDDNQTPATDSEVAVKIVEQDKPFAIVPVVTGTFPAAAYLNAKGVPFIGFGIVPDWCKKHTGFSLTGCTDPALATSSSNFVQIDKQAFPDKTAKGKRIAIISGDSDSAKISVRNFAKVWKYNGAKVVYAENPLPVPPIVVSDYTPYAQAVVDSKPDYVEVVASVTNGQGVATKLRQLGYKGIIQGFSFYDPRIAKSADGIYNQVTFAPWEQTTTPAVAQMIKDVNAVAPDATKGTALEAGYWSADLFLQILQKAGKNLSRESFVAAGAKLKYNGQGATSNLQWPKSWTQSGNGAALVLGDGTGYSVAAPYVNLPAIPTAKLK